MAAAHDFVWVVCLLLPPLNSLPTFKCQCGHIYTWACRVKSGGKEPRTHQEAKLQSGGGDVRPPAPPPVVSARLLLTRGDTSSV